MKLKQLSPTVFMLLFITLMAGAVRLTVISASSMPLNDGGLFYQMIADLQANGYRLPVFTTYNNDSLPFAYPPLAFYIGGLAQQLSGLALLDVVRLLPPAVSLFAIPILYFLAKEITQNEVQAFFASLCFAFLPLAFSWQIMGGGLTRAPGQVFALLTMLAALRLYRDRSRRAIFGAGLFGALVVLTHPEAALQSVLAVGLLFLFYARSWQAVRDSLVAAGLVLVFSSPWWVTVLSRFGVAPFLAVATAAVEDNVSLLYRLIFLFRINSPGESLAIFIACLGILGAFLSLARRQYFLPVWLLATIVLDHRSGIRFAMIPLAMLGGMMLDQIITLLKNENLAGSKIKSLQQAILGSSIQRLFFGYLFTAFIISSFFVTTNLKNSLAVSAPEQNAAEWIRLNLPESATIATITEAHPLADPFTEWLPTLTQRKIITSVFGYEWLNDSKSFRARLTAYRSLQNCAQEHPACLEDWMTGNGRVDYYVLRMGNADTPRNMPLYIWLLNDAKFEKMYEKNNIVIFLVTE
jgi:hypothetical protein